MSNQKPIPENQQIKVGLSWDIQQGCTVDLDAQCVLLNDIGQIEEAIYFNQLTSSFGKIQHSGDSLGESDDYDEVITIDLHTLSFQIRYIFILICSYNGKSFKEVESAKVDILCGGSMWHQVGVGSKGDHNTCIGCIFAKEWDGKWVFWGNEDSDAGKTFLECEGLIKRNLVKIGFDEVLFQESKTWTGGKSFQLSKNNVAIIPSSLQCLQVGLGWDTHCDIDSSIILMDGQNQLSENIYYGKKKSDNLSVQHHGDNTSGVGSGDDETIEIQLDKIPTHQKSIWVVITVFTNNYQFDDVKGAYCRLYEKNTGKEFCKFNLSLNKDNLSNGCIMCSIMRFQDSWGIQARGYYTKGTNNSVLVVDIIKQVMNNNYLSITVMDHQLKQTQIQAVNPPPQAIQAPQVVKPESNKRIYNITILQGNGFGAFDSNGKSDPYVKVMLNGLKVGKENKTNVIKCTLNPYWNFVIKSVLLKVGDILQFSIYDWDFMATDDYMGTCMIQLTEEFITQSNKEVKLAVTDTNYLPNPKYPGELIIKFDAI